MRCAQASLDWLARHAGVRRSVCLAVDGETGLLVGIAGVGVPIDDVELFSASLGDTQDPVVRALTSAQPTVLRPAGKNGALSRAAIPLGAAPFTAIPLRGTRQHEDDAVGLLLMRTGTAITGDVQWLMTVLGQKIDQIRGRGSLAEEVRKLRRERALFFTIINAVTDPIMLTDTEGRLIVANARAEKLFAATEEESEGT